MFWLFWRQFLGDGSLAESPSTAAGMPVGAHDSAAPAPVYAFFDAFGDQALSIFNERGECTCLSDNWKKLTGHSNADSSGLSFYGHLHNDHQSIFRQALQGVRRASDNINKTFKCQMRHADGEWQWYDVCVASARRNDMGGLEIACILRNVTQDVITKQTLQKAKLEAELALKGRSEFLSNMSHELRTPLNAIIGFAQMMQNQLFGRITNKRYLEYLKNIDESGHTLLSRINDLIEISDIEIGRITLDEEVVDINDIIRSAVEIHSHRAFAELITIEERLLSQPLMVKVDRVKLKQSLGNIIANALRHTNEGGTVSIQCKQTSSGDITITISDTGRGIAPKQLHNISQAFAQENTFFASDINGIGLGLALVKELMNMHQGSVTIKSRAGSGCTVTLTLPASRVVTARAKIQRSESRKKSIA